MAPSSNERLERVYAKRLLLFEHERPTFLLLLKRSVHLMPGEFIIMFVLLVVGVLMEVAPGSDGYGRFIIGITLGRMFSWVHNVRSSVHYAQAIKKLTDWQEVHKALAQEDSAKTQ